jgi:hypothetical protein
MPCASRAIYPAMDRDRQIALQLILYRIVVCTEWVGRSDRSAYTIIASAIPICIGMSGRCRDYRHGNDIYDLHRYSSSLSKHSASDSISASSKMRILFVNMAWRTLSARLYFNTLRTLSPSQIGPKLPHTWCDSALAPTQLIASLFRSLRLIFRSRDLIFRFGTGAGSYHWMQIALISRSDLVV